MDLDAYFAEHGSGGKPQETGEGAGTLLKTHIQRMYCIQQ